MNKKKRRDNESKKVVARLNTVQWDRLSKVRERYGFTSNYAIMQYLVACFLRVADPEHDETEEPVPDEIKDMFADYSEAEKHFEFVKPKRKLSQYEFTEKMRGQIRLWEN